MLTGERAGPACGLVTDSPMPIIGQARPHGPLSIACDAAARQAHHPERSHNVIYHEFAHALDMLTGSASGAPLLPTKEERVRWMEVCTAEYRLLQQGEGGHLLDRYGSVNPGEFFASPCPPSCSSTNRWRCNGTKVTCTTFSRASIARTQRNGKATAGLADVPERPLLLLLLGFRTLGVLEAQLAVGAQLVGPLE